MCEKESQVVEEYVFTMYIAIIALNIYFPYPSMIVSTVIRSTKYPFFLSRDIMFVFPTK